MPFLIQPVIGTVANVAVYLGMNASALAGTIEDGVTTLGDYVQSLLNETAWLIVEWCDFDYTPSQKAWDSWIGNDTYYHALTYKMTTGTFFTRCPVGGNPFNEYTVLNGGSDITSGGNVGPNTNIICNPGGPNGLTSFSSAYIYTLEYTTGNMNTYRPVLRGATAGWPLVAIQVQVEMVGIIIRESAAGWGGGGTGQLNASLGQIGMADRLSINNMPNTLHFIDLFPRWQKLLRPYRKMSI